MLYLFIDDNTHFALFFYGCRTLLTSAAQVCGVEFRIKIIR
jgi:hypothetical protein